jgi:hypothetical protein
MATAYYINKNKTRKCAPQATKIHRVSESQTLDTASQMRDIFLAPLAKLLHTCANQRQCPAIPDLAWLTLGIQRSLEHNVSGRAFLQDLGNLQAKIAPTLGHFFESLKSKRRLALCSEINAALMRKARRDLPDNLAQFPALADYDIYAGDGHFHQHATHDPADANGRKHAVGHLYAADLRTGCLRHLSVADQIHRKKEHDIRNLKRLTTNHLRMDAPTGRKVLYVWDRAGIDFSQWHKWKKASGIYLLSRCKSNMNLVVCGQNPIDHTNPLNTGVTADRIVGGASVGVQMRHICYTDSDTGTDYEFITNLNDPDIAPGLIAHLYQLRWRIEKRFDEIKNKMLERKAWASSATAKSMQAEFICLTINLLNYLDERLKIHGVENTAEKKRKAKVLEKKKENAKKRGIILPAICEMTATLTQHSVKLIRWISALWNQHTTWEEAIPILSNQYSTQ